MPWTEEGMTCDVCMKVGTHNLAYPQDHGPAHCEAKHVALMCGWQEIKSKGCETAWVCMTCAWTTEGQTKFNGRIYKFDHIKKNNVTYRGVCPQCIDFAKKYWADNRDIAEQMCYPDRVAQGGGPVVELDAVETPLNAPPPGLDKGRGKGNGKGNGASSSTPAAEPADDLRTELDAVKNKMEKQSRRIKKVAASMKNSRPLTYSSWSDMELFDGGFEFPPNFQ